MNNYVKTLLLGSVLATSYNLQAKDWNKVDSCPYKEVVDPVTKIKTKEFTKAACKVGFGKDIDRPNKIFDGRIIFDFDTDGCLASSPIIRKGIGYEANPGTKPSGAIDGECAYKDQLDNADVLYQEVCEKVQGVDYCARVFALYTVKDMWSSGYNGHRNDFEHAVIWMKGGKPEYVGTSAHGSLTNLKANEFPRLSSSPQSMDFNTFTVVYHRAGVSTHSFRPSKSKNENGVKVNTETPENPRKPSWFIPKYIDLNNSKVSDNYKYWVNSDVWGDAKLELNPKRLKSFLFNKQPPEWKKLEVFKNPKN